MEGVEYILFIAVVAVPVVVTRVVIVVELIRVVVVVQIVHTYIYNSSTCISSRSSCTSYYCTG